MNGERIFLVAKKYLFSRFLKFEEIIDFAFWPVCDIIIWGGVGLTLAQGNIATSQVTLSVLSVVLWRVYMHAFFNNAVNFLYEMMSRNILNLFSSPLTFVELLCGGMLTGCMLMVCLILFSTLVAWLIFGIFILHAGPALALFIVPLLITGWALSNVTIIVLMRLGVHAQRLTFVMAWLFVPFSGVYYQLDTMPLWVQIISKAVPMSYIFSALRIFILENRIVFADLGRGYFLAMVYFIVAYSACNYMFERTRQHGLADLERA